jgi:hypothetical protein
MKTREQLMDERHAAYLKAKASKFLNERDTSSWRDANRRYVQAKDTFNERAAGNIAKVLEMPKSSHSGRQVGKTA